MIAAAALLLGAGPFHALIGCDWGTKVALPDDQEVCTARAQRRLIIHGRNGETYDLQVCDPHAAVIEQQTDPHAPGEGATP